MEHSWPEEKNFYEINLDVNQIRIDFVKDDCDSDDERFMVWWLRSMTKAGYIRKCGKASTFSLCPNIPGQTYRQHKKNPHRQVYNRLTIASRPVVYTPDFVIYWSEDYVKSNPSYFQEYEIAYDTDLYLRLGRTEDYNPNAFFFVTKHAELGYVSVIDVKPDNKGFSNKHRDFPTKQKFLFHTYSLFVQEFVLIKNKVPVVFKEIACPQRFLTGNKSTRSRKLHFNPKTILP